LLGQPGLVAMTKPFELRLLPYERFTLVSSQPAGEVLAKLRQATQPRPDGSPAPALPARFVGQVNAQNFWLTQRAAHPNLYLPVLRGEVAATSAGCIIFVQCTLPASTQVLLLFWLGVAAFMVVVYLFSRPNYSHAAFAFLMGGAFYTVSLANFNLQKKASRELLERAIG
jgi:hypothetical protein